MDLFTKTPKNYSLVLSLLIIVFSIVCAFTLPSCKDQTNQNLTSNIVFPASGVSFNKQVGPLFQQTCVASGCHGGSQPAANLNLEVDAWHSLIDFLPQIVIPNHGSTSPLVLYLNGGLAPQMPLRQSPLTTNQINGVKTWINEGAKNN